MYEEGVLGGFLFRGSFCLVNNRPLLRSEGIDYHGVLKNIGAPRDYVKRMTLAMHISASSSTLASALFSEGMIHDMPEDFCQSF